MSAIPIRLRGDVNLSVGNQSHRHGSGVRLITGTTIAQDYIDNGRSF